jgi:ABC-type sugar transport system substrate-binding protein
LRKVNVIVGQNDQMAVAARQAFEGKKIEVPPAIGCDGVPSGGQQLVRRGELAATVIVPPTTPAAVDVANAFWRGAAVPAITAVESVAFPPPKELRKK